MQPYYATVSYQTLAHRLMREILSGSLEPGQRLPPLREMAKEHHACVGTVRRALDRLRCSGVIRTRRGVDFVTSNPDQIRAQQVTYPVMQSLFLPQNLMSM